MDETEDWGYIPNDGNNNGAGTVTAGVLDNSTTTTGGDAWGGFWSGLGAVAGKVLDYGIAKDAYKNGMVTGLTPNGQPVYQPVQQRQPVYGMQVGSAGGISGNVLLIGGAVALGLVVALVARR